MLITYLIDGKIIYKQLLAEGRLQFKFFFEIHLRRENKNQNDCYSIVRCCRCQWTELW